MAEKIVSPGVFTNEVDQSFLPAGVQAIGAAVVGPTTKGPANIPTIVSSYAEYSQIFGGKFESGSGAYKNTYKYLTDYAAQEYLKYSDTLTVVRILASGYGPANSTVSSSTSTGATYASGAIALVSHSVGGTTDTFGNRPDDEFQITINGVEHRFITADPYGGIPMDISASNGGQNGGVFYYATGSKLTGGAAAAETPAQLAVKINAAFSVGVTNGTILAGQSVNASGSKSPLNRSAIFISASHSGTWANTISVDTGSGTTFSNALISKNTGDGIAIADTVFTTFGGGTNTAASANAFILETLADGQDQNSVGPQASNNLLRSGSTNNLRWEVSRKNNSKGTFDLLIRRGNDTSNRKMILEQFSNLTLDPNSPNFITRVIGDQKQTLRDGATADPFLQMTGSYANRSRYVRVRESALTLNYLDENGNIRLGSLSGSLPTVSSGSFANGSDGSITHPRKHYDEITDDNTQGFNLSGATTGLDAYTDAINLLKNQDEYDINLLTLPGLFDNFTNHATVVTKALNMVENRGDCFLIIDPTEYASSISQVTAKADARDSNYAAVYWPWIKIPDPDLGKNVWVPPSVCIPSVYAFNDRVSAPWFAPAGLNRGGIDVAVQAERKLTHANRDTLYDSNVNPIATFPNAGVTVFGQKTLQKKASALDRVNVRRLLIAAKKFIASTTRFLVFENNTAATRNRFLSIVNPYFESVQQRQGLYAFKVVMDETNNTPDVIDRNEMRGQIFLQPAKTAEFIIIDFNVLPTGAAFPE